MNKKILSISAAIIAAMGALVACHESVIDETNGNNTNEEITISGQLVLTTSDISAYDNCKVNSICEESIVSNGQFSVDAYHNDRVQTFALYEEDNIYLLSRAPIAKGERIELSPKSTTIALVTLHPLFSPIKCNEYQDIVDMILSSSCYQPLYEEVEKAISEKRNIFDENNDALLLAFSNLVEDICGEVDDTDYSGSLDDIASENQQMTRAIYENPKIYPLYAEINNNILTLRNTGLTPSYFGTVRNANGGTDNIAVKSRSDYGGLDLFKTVGEINLGPECNYTFQTQGQYQFSLSRMNEAATADFYLRIANNILTTLGLDLGNDAVQEIGNSISRAIINAGSGVDDAVIDPMEWVGIAYNATLEQLKTGTFFSHGVSESFVFTCKFLLGSLNWYNKIKGIGNAATRISYALSAPKELNFCLCYYNGEISTCTTVSLEKIGGDGQTGYSKQRLLLPLEVYVSTLGDDGNYTSPSSYHRIKFEVISGGGSVEDEYVSANMENKASTYWILGEEDNQQVKATVVDMITDKEISEPVYFTADLNSAQITIRLDWSKHSCNTDIDLHVVDPYGEEIAYYHMTSASGGYLDRDDIVGPGPEHVRWSSAPVGTYKIYVHYYPNEAEDRSVTSYKVSVNANGVAYQPKTGSIAYNQMVPVGQFTIGESSTARSISFRTLDDTAPVNKITLPKKK